MKTLFCVTTISLLFITVGLSSAHSQTQEFEGYTIVKTIAGQEVCLGTWVQPDDVALSGYCQGQMIDSAQLSAISARQSTERLDQLLLTLASIDQRLADNNDQVKGLIQATVNAQLAIEQQAGQISEFLQETITKRFDALPKEMIANDLFKKELAKLKEDILQEVEKSYSKLPKTSTK
ncbi:MAG: hypothetical protein ABR903_05430 [Thermodesulfovibrionales bacterium]|jgi:hypothetical protein